MANIKHITNGITACLFLCLAAACGEKEIAPFPITPEGAGTIEISGLPPGVTGIRYEIRQHGEPLGAGSADRTDGMAAILGLRSLPDQNMPADVIIGLAFGEGPAAPEVKSVSFHFSGILTRTGPALFQIPFPAFDQFLPPPDGRPFPGSPLGDPIPDPRGTTPPPGSILRPIIDGVAAAKAQATPLLSGTATISLTVANPNPPPDTVTQQFMVTWDIRPDGSCRITLPNGVVFDVIFDASGDVKRVVYVTPPPPVGVHYGESHIFIGTGGDDPAAPDHCTDAIWVQYVHRTIQFSGGGNTIGPLHEKGPEIDEQVPYANQSQDGAPGSPMMEDAPGVSLPLGQGNSLQSVINTLDRLQGEYNVDDDAISKAVETWDFDTYLICLAPVYRVIGHFDWGFTITVQAQNPRFRKTNVRPPAWVSGF